MTRRRRRVVAPPTRLGASEEGDLTALAPGRATPAPVSDPTGVPAAAGTDGPQASATGEGPAIPDRAREDTDEAWGQGPEDDARLIREKPPHWQ